MGKENLSDRETASMEAEIRARREGENKRETFQHYGPAENLSDQEIESMEAEIRARREGENKRETFQHYGPAENLSDQEIESMEAEIRARREGYNNREIFQHYGSVENLDEAGIRSIEAQVAEKRKQDIPYKEYFKNLINDPQITDQAEFESAVLRSMESNRVMREFVENLCEKIGDKTFELKNTDKNDKDKIAKVKQEIEKMVDVYVRYMYTLKENEWDFSDLHAMKMPEYVTDNLWQQQKRLDVVFTMPIPVDMGKDYGKKFERDGKMIPGFEFMYQDLSGKEVNWHQVMIYKENELTPQQRFYRRQMLKNITPSEATKNALKAGTTADKVNEANVVERSGLDLENNNEGVTKDDD